MKTTKLLFPTPIWEDDDCGLDTKEIQDFCYLVEKEDPQGRKATNYGGGDDLFEGEFPIKENSEEKIF